MPANKAGMVNRPNPGESDPALQRLGEHGVKGGHVLTDQDRMATRATNIPITGPANALETGQFLLAASASSWSAAADTW